MIEKQQSDFGRDWRGEDKRASMLDLARRSGDG
jgi:hypothetical protein